MKKLILSFLMLPGLCWAWGRRGHQIVAESAALAANPKSSNGFLRNHSFDLGYYANVPDFIWKRPATYEMEHVQHFIDMEHFTKSFAAKPDVKDPFALSRAEFEAAFPEVKPNSGRAFWRIRELNDQLTEITRQLRELPDQTGKARHALQEKWLLTAGVMSHYVGDLGMPLHMSENYDGQLTEQKGIHSYFEDKLVDEIFPELALHVQQRVSREFPSFQKANAKKSVLELIRQLGDSSFKAIDPLLKLDKKNKRDPSVKSAKIFEKMLQDRMTEAALTLAEIFSRQLDFTFDEHKFYFFAGEPEYIKPGVPAPSQKK